MTYYAETAFNSSRPRKLAPEPAASTFLQKSAKTYSVAGYGIQCKEYSVDNYDFDYIDHEQINWSVPLIPSFIIVMFIISVILLALGLIVLSEELASVFFSKEDAELYVIYLLLYFVVLNFLFIKLYRHGLEKNWKKTLSTTVAGAVFALLGYVFFSVKIDRSLMSFSDLDGFILLAIALVSVSNILLFIYSFFKTKGYLEKKGIVSFNRRTGMVTFPFKKKIYTYPFDELFMAVKHSAGYSAEIYHYPFFFHKYSGSYFTSNRFFWHFWQAEVFWEFIQHYMDISQPLPDTRNLEPYRDLDPVIVRWDNSHNRPKNYWKDLDAKMIEEMQKKAINAARDYPWGQSRDQAIIAGWRPSGVGEGDWQKKE